MTPSLCNNNIVTLQVKSDANNKPLRECVTAALQSYLSTLQGHPPSALYDMVLQEIEEPMLRVVLEHTAGNQTKAAQVLGLNRGTLRKKLKQYGLQE